LMQAQYTDQLLGDIISRLQALGMWDDMLVVVTADHGRSLQPNTRERAFTLQTLDSNAYAPLIIKLPNQKQGAIDDSNIMAYDILPTIADVLGIEIPWPVTGIPAGHDDIAARSDQKESYPRESNAGFSAGLGEKLIFSDKEHFPEYSDRWVGALKEEGDPLMLLNEALELGRFLNHSTADFTSEPGGNVTVEVLDQLRQPAVGETPLGVVMGHLDFDPSGGKVLISVNGRFVTGSELVELGEVQNSFVAMLPSGILGEHNDIGVLLVQGDRLSQLDVD
jgi:hypothetical protein